MNLWIIFLTGLTVGGLTCLAVQGGLLASVIAAREEEEIEKGINKKNTLLPTLAFLVSKLTSYTVLGFILGGFGGALNISPNVQIALQFLAGVYMVSVALNLLNVHPVFRYVVIQPPRFLTRMVRSQSKSKDLYAPVLLGAMTVFIPCGTTLSMEALAISSANAFFGAAVMFTFVLGTMPLFFGVGWLTTVLGDNFRGRFLKIAAFLVLYLGVTSANGALVAGGSPVTLQTIAENSPVQFDFSGGDNQYATTTNGTKNIKEIGGIQVADITVYPNGYNPTYFQVRAGKPVKLNLETIGNLGCTAVFRVPSYGITKILQKNSIASIEFTPQNRGRIVFTCSMGMYSGIIEVI